MIIIDGLDKTGKSTLQEGLVKQYEWAFPFRLTRANIDDNRFDDFGSDYWKTFALIQKIEMITVTQLQKTGRLCGMTVDRFHGTEWSYLEEGEAKDLGYIWELDEKLSVSKYPAVLIFLDASVGWIMDHLDENERDQMHERRLKIYRHRFLDFFDSSRMTKIRIAIETHDIQSVLKTAQMFLDETQYIFKQILTTEIHKPNYFPGSIKY